MSVPPFIPRAGFLAAVALLPSLLRRLRNPVVRVEPGELKHRLDSKEDVTIVDVREPAEFAGALGHIAGARNLPVGELDRRTSELDGLEQCPLVVVCRTDKRSATAARLLHQAGFARVAILRGGMEQWNREKLPTEATAEGP